jgi:hypothetical protein
MLGPQGLWAGRDLYRATPAVTQDLGFSSLIRRTAPFSRHLRHMRGCGESILTQILTGCFVLWKNVPIYYKITINHTYIKRGSTLYHIKALSISWRSCRLQCTSWRTLYCLHYFRNWKKNIVVYKYQYLSSHIVISQVILMYATCTSIRKSRLI